MPVKIPEWKLYHHHHTYFQVLHITKLKKTFVVGPCLKCKCNSLKVSPYFNSFKQERALQLPQGRWGDCKRKAGEIWGFPLSLHGVRAAGLGGCRDQQPKKAEGSFRKGPILILIFNLGVPLLGGRGDSYDPLVLSPVFLQQSEIIWAGSGCKNCSVHREGAAGEQQQCCAYGGC